MRPWPSRSTGGRVSAGRSPASGSVRSPTAVNPLQQVVRVRFGLRVTAVTDRAGMAVAGQPEG